MIPVWDYLNLVEVDEHLRRPDGYRSRELERAFKHGEFKKIWPHMELIITDKEIKNEAVGYAIFFQ